MVRKAQIVKKIENMVFQEMERSQFWQGWTLAPALRSSYKASSLS